MMNRLIAAGTLLLSIVALPAATQEDVRRPLAYVESSTGLIPPTMEGGRTEVEMGDVDGDGNIDLVSVGDHGSPFVNTDQHGVMVWFGDGAGSWSVAMTGSFGYGGVALGDVNGDAHLDVAYGIHHDYSGNDLGDQLLEVALGDGTGLGWTPWDDGLATNGETWGMFSTDFADVDGDGDLDVGSVSFGCCAGVHIYLNMGDGTWQQSFGFVGGNSGMHFEFGDVNRDGSPDFAVSQQYGVVYLGDGAGNFSSGDGNLPPSGSLGAIGVSLGDVNHDGADELAFCNGAGGVEVWSMVGPGSWADLSVGLPAAGSCEATQLHDMDVDGHLDVAVFGDGLCTVWAGDGAGSWTEAASFTTPSPGDLSAFRVGGDADHNGRPDIALVSDEGSWPSYRNHAHFFRESSSPTALAVAAVYPHGGEIVRAGSVVFLDWITAVPVGEQATVALELSANGPAGPWQVIAGSLPDNGRYQWRIPPETSPSADCSIRYTATTPSGTETTTTPATFTILASPEILIFQDGFESGDTSAWSSSFAGARR
jgi:hypothetical protein